MTDKKQKKVPKGIGGWLILPTIGFFIGILIYLFLATASALVIILGESDSWTIIYLIFSVINLPLFGYVIYLEFSKKKQFPTWAIILMWFGVVASIVFSIKEDTYGMIVSDFFMALVWTGYFTVSERVKNTFVK